jgi:hypothetical protein
MSAISTTPVADRRGPGFALLVAGLCVAGLVLTWVLAELVPVTHVRDAVALYDFTRLDRPFVEVPANLLLALFEPWFFAVWGIVLVALALSQGRSRVALAVALVLSLAPGSAELLKPLVAHPHAQVVPLYITKKRRGRAVTRPRRRRSRGVRCSSLPPHAGEPLRCSVRCWSLLWVVRS